MPPQTVWMIHGAVGNVDHRDVKPNKLLIISFWFIAEIILYLLTWDFSIFIKLHESSCNFLRSTLSCDGYFFFWWTFLFLMNISFSDGHLFFWWTFIFLMDISFSDEHLYFSDEHFFFWWTFLFLMNFSFSDGHFFCHYINIVNNMLTCADRC